MVVRPGFDVPRYWLHEVRAHEHPDDLWMILYDEIYDVTSFCKRHPGGIEVLLDCAGVDATEAFEDVGHSDVALDLLRPHFVGRLYESESKRVLEKRKLESPEPVSYFAEKQDEPRDYSTLLLVAAVCVAVLIILAIQHIKWASLSSRS